MKRPTSSECRELLDLLVDLDGLSRTAAKHVLRTATNDSLFDMLNALRRKKLEVNGQQRIRFESSKPVAASEPRQRSKKTPYTLLLPPEQLAALRALSEDDGASVSHHIRQAIRLYLRKR